MTTETKTDDIEREDKRDSIRKRQREREKEVEREKERQRREGKRWVTGSPSKSNGGERGNSGKDRACRRTRQGQGEPAVEETETGGRKGGIQFNFLRNSLVFEIQPPKGCARG